MDRNRTLSAIAIVEAVKAALKSKGVVSPPVPPTPNLPVVNPPLEVIVTRELGLPWFELTLPDGTSEELDPEETREWFRLRRANMDIVENCLDDVWAFGNGIVVIHNPRILKKNGNRMDPKL